tara:strand:+ start:828 stop:1070 length:243 start_codon:yes stop_codon:yes gene_type:complete
MVSNSSWFNIIKQDGETGKRGSDKKRATHTKEQSTLPQELLDTALSEEQVKEIKRRNPKVVPAKGVEEGGNLKQTKLGDY